jgi:2-polyprenyl-3-methyl-5-hydroxy-6-metoxy-1,4-benzoquinol methylase
VPDDDRQSLADFNESVFAGRVFEARESRLRKALAAFERERGRGPLLDVAAGSGLAAEALAAQGWTVTGLDLSAQLVEQIRARPGVHEALQHDLSAGPLPFGDGTFAAVFAGEIIEHLVDTRRFLDELRRVLRPGGLLVLTTPNLASFENRVRLLFGVYPAWLEYELSSQGHVRAYTKRTLRSHLRATGFSVESIAGNWVPFVPQALVHDVRWPALARTGDWLPGLSQGLIAAARRP